VKEKVETRTSFFSEHQVALTIHSDEILDKQGQNVRRRAFYFAPTNYESRKTDIGMCYIPYRSKFETVVTTQGGLQASLCKDPIIGFFLWNGLGERGNAAMDFELSSEKISEICCEKKVNCFYIRLIPRPLGQEDSANPTYFLGGVEYIESIL